MNFALIGAAGYIAPRHMKAIKDTGNTLVAAVDPHDSVGILDSFGYNTQFFTDIERFDRHMYKLSRKPYEQRIHYVSVCSPNYLHDSHCRLALNNDADVICEKPLAINPWNLDLLEEAEKDSCHQVYPIMQMRYHPKVLELKKNLNNKHHEVFMNYYTPRGIWYYHSWKGDSEKSGGLLMNIGIHMFDLLIWLFGKPRNVDTNYIIEYNAHGSIIFDNADVKWSLSIDPRDAKLASRQITIDDESIDFSNVTSLDLHTVAYKEILEGRGFGIEDARPAIELVRRIKYG